MSMASTKKWTRRAADFEVRTTFSVVGGGAAGLMAAGAALERGLSVCLFDKNRQLGQQGAHHRQGPLQRDQQLPGGGGGGRLPPGREVPLRGALGFFPPGHHGLFRGPGRPLKDGAGPAGVPRVGQCPRHRRRPGAVCRPGPPVHPAGCDGRPRGKRPGRGGAHRRRERTGAAASSSAAGAPLTRAPAPTGTATSWPRLLGHTIVTPTPSLVPLVERGAWCSPADGPLPAQLRGKGDPAGQEEARLRGFRRSCCSPTLGFRGLPS